MLQDESVPMEHLVPTSILNAISNLHYWTSSDSALQQNYYNTIENEVANSSEFMLLSKAIN